MDVANGGFAGALTGPGCAGLLLQPVDSARVPAGQSLHEKAKVLRIRTRINDQVYMVATHMDVGNAERVWNNDR